MDHFLLCSVSPPWLVQISGSGINEFGDSDEIVGDDIEQKVAGNVGDAPVLGLSQSAMLLAPSEHAFDQFEVGLRHCVTGLAATASKTMLVRRLPVLVRASLRATCGVTLSFRESAVCLWPILDHPRSRTNISLRLSASDTCFPFCSDVILNISTNPLAAAHLPAHTCRSRFGNCCASNALTIRRCAGLITVR